MNAQIEVNSVSKFFVQSEHPLGVGRIFGAVAKRKRSQVMAVNNISFDITAGDAVGYLGPNGAGKSTMIKMLTGILVPDQGSISVLGKVPHLNRIENAKKIGVVFGQRSQLWWDLPVMESFDLHRRIHAISKSRYMRNLNYFADLLEIGPFLKRTVRQLSLGQRMRAELLMCLLHDPCILFLDEPTIGLDVVAKDVVRKFLKTLNEESNVTIILTTHDLQDIEQICGRLLLVDRGESIFDGKVADLRRTLGSRRKLTLEFSSIPAAPLALSAGRLVKDEGLIKHYLIDDDQASFFEVMKEIGSADTVRDLRFTEPSIEEVIRTFYQNLRA